MNLDDVISTFPPEIRESSAMKGLVTLIQTLQEQLQKTQEQLTKSQERIKVLEDELAKFRKTPKRPKFHPNGMQPRNRNNPQLPSDPTSPIFSASLVQKER